MAQEVMIVTPAIQNLIREGKVAQMYSAIQTGLQMGMMTMEQSLAHLVKTGVISLEMAASKSSKPAEMQRLLTGGGGGLPPSAARPAGTLKSPTRSAAMVFAVFVAGQEQSPSL